MVSPPLPPQIIIVALLDKQNNIELMQYVNLSRYILKIPPANHYKNTLLAGHESGQVFFRNVFEPYYDKLRKFLNCKNPIRLFCYDCFIVVRTKYGNKIWLKNFV